MQIDPHALTPRQRYKVMSGCVIPRPIAWVSSQSRAGDLNVAPFSFFNTLGGTPPMLCFSVGARDGELKDTARNVIETEEFVVNLVDEHLAEQMNATAAEVPPEVNEFELAGITPAPSVKVGPPRIAEAPVSFECTLYHRLPLKETGNNLFVGEVVWIHVRDDLITGDYHIDAQRLRPIGRLAGAQYSYVRDLFDMPRITYEEALKRKARRE